MLRLEQITDSQQLRQVAELLESENRRLHKRLALLVQEVATLKGKSGTEQLQLELMKLQEQMATLQHRMFGRSSEKRPHCAAEGASDPSPPPPRHGHGPREQPLLPTLEKHHSLPESERTCLVCSGPMEPLGEQTEDAQEITVVERRFVLVTHKRHKYRCRCNAQVQTAPGPLKLQSGGRYSLEFAIQVALDKYAYHRVPRMHTLKPEGRREKQCCTKDEGRPLGVGLQGQTSNHFVLREAKARVVSDEGKGARILRQVWFRKTNASKPLMMGRKVS